MDASLTGVAEGRSLRRFTVDEYHQLIDRGILGEDDRVELLEGLIVRMTPQNRPHTVATSRLAKWLNRKACGDELTVRVQMPLTLDTSEPEPDIAVIAASDEDDAARHPRTAMLVVEVSGDSLQFDRSTKAALYARARVALYWVVSVAAKNVEVFSDPDSEAGLYRSRRTLTTSDTLRFGESSLPVSALFR